MERIGEVYKIIYRLVALAMPIAKSLRGVINYTSLRLIMVQYLK